MAQKPSSSPSPPPIGEATARIRAQQTLDRYPLAIDTSPKEEKTESENNFNLPERYYEQQREILQECNNKKEARLEEKKNEFEEEIEFNEEPQNGQFGYMVDPRDYDTKFEFVKFSIYIKNTLYYTETKNNHYIYYTQIYIKNIKTCT